MMSISSKFGLCALFAAILATTSARALTIQETQVDPGDTFQVGTAVTFTCVVVSGSAISFVWNFDDNTGDIPTVTNTITHTFNTEDIFQVIVQAIDADGNPAHNDADIIIVEAVNLPPPNSPVGVGANDPPLTNPDDGLGIDIDNQQGGVVSMHILTDDPSGSAAVRASDEFRTKWGDDPSDLDGRRGNPMVHKYGAFNNDPNPRKGGVATIEVTRNSGGSIIGKMRKTLALSNREISGSNTEANDDSVTDKKIGIKSFAGKFAFQKFGFNDQVSISWTMTLPAGFAPAAQTMTLSVGNVTEDVEIDSKGKGKIDKKFPGVFTSVKLKYPKLAKGTTTTSAPFLTTVTAKMKQEDLEEAGFDTEGVSARANHPRGSTGPVLGPKDRDIQVLSVFAGVGYSGVAKVTINVDKNDDIGSLKTRR